MLSMWSSARNFLCNDRAKFRVYIALNRPQTWLDCSYQYFLTTLIISCVFLTFFTNSHAIGHPLGSKFLFYLDLTIAIIFGLEFIVRLWSSTCLHRYRNWRGIHIVLHPMFVIDLLVLGTTIAVLCYDIQETMLAVSLRGFRILHLFESRFKLWKTVSSVMWSQRYQLLMVTYFCVVWLVVFSLAIYLVESPHNPQMTSLSKALWFTLVSFTTVGYGDIVPITPTGKILVSIGMIVGVSIFALPGGVIGAGMALKVQHQQRTSHSKKPSLRENLAAKTLQNAWRLYQIDKQRKLTENSDVSGPPRIPISIHGRRIRLSLYRPIMNGSSEQKIDLELTEKPKHSSRRFDVNAHLLYFIYLLRYRCSKRHFRRSRRLSDTDTFYEVYEQNSQSTAQMLKGLQSQLSKLEKFAEDYKQAKMLSRKRKYAANNGLRLRNQNNAY